MIGEIKIIDTANKKALKNCSNDPNAEEAESNGEPEIKAEFSVECKCGKGAQHKEAAMGKVEHPQNPKDKGEPCGKKPEVHRKT